MVHVLLTPQYHLLIECHPERRLSFSPSRRGDEGRQEQRKGEVCETRIVVEGGGTGELRDDS